MDLMDDYLFFGGAFKWQPGEVKKLRWSWRKQMRQAYEDKMKDVPGMDE